MLKDANEKVIYKDESFRLQGACFEVYKNMGAGFLENVYQECLEKEFTSNDIPFESQKDLIIEYKGTKLKQYYKADFICFDKIIIEIKAVKELIPEHSAQLFNYLKATKIKLGLLVNFGHFPKVQIVRIVL